MKTKFENAYDMIRDHRETLKIHGGSYVKCVERGSLKYEIEKSRPGEAFIALKRSIFG